MFYMRLCCFCCMMRCMMQMSLSRVRMVSRQFMIARLMMPCCFAVVLCGVLEVFRCFVVMFCRLL